jgi:hypothetical protein
LLATFRARRACEPLFLFFFFGTSSTPSFVASCPPYGRPFSLLTTGYVRIHATASRRLRARASLHRPVVDLRCAFAYGNGQSLLVKDLRGFSGAELTELVARKGGVWELLSPWLARNNLDSLLRGDSIWSDVLLALKDLSLKVASSISDALKDLSLKVDSIKAVQEPRAFQTRNVVPTS